MLSELYVVNAALGSIGQAPITSLAKPHRLAAAAMSKLTEAMIEVQSVRWFFNVRTYDVIPDESDDFRVDSQLPSNLIQLTGEDRPVTLREPGKLYDLRTNEFVTTKTKVKVHALVPWSELPVQAQIHIKDVAVLKFFRDYDKDPTAGRTYEQAAQNSYIILNAEHIRTIGANMLLRKSVQADMHYHRGHRPYLRN